MTLSKKATKLLRKINRADLFPAKKASKYDESVIRSLLEHHYIDGEISCVDIEYGRATYSFYSITESGRAYLDARNSDTFRFWLPLILSSVSLFLSALSIVLSPYFSAFFSYLYGL